MTFKKVILNYHDGTEHHQIYPKTSADLVETDEQRLFVSTEEKEAWDAKVDADTLIDYVKLVDGKIDPAILPAVAITETFVVPDEAAMLALTVQKGDIAFREDENGKAYILAQDDATVLENWIPLSSGASSAVTSVNKKTGAVELTKEDIGLDKVENLSKEEILENATLTGVPTAPTAAAGTDSTQVATTEFVNAALSGFTGGSTEMSVNPPTNQTKGSIWLQEIV